MAAKLPTVSVAADLVAFSRRPDTGLSVLLVKRRFDPHKGRLAFPGGFVEQKEDLPKAAAREFLEETGLKLGRTPLHQLGAYGNPRRDSRGRVISVVHVALLGPDREPVAGDDAAAADWYPVADLLGSRRLAFDHATILADAWDWLGRRLEHDLAAADLVGPEFTIAELREVYEEVWGRPLDPGNFQRKVTGIPGLLEDTGARSSGGRGRPAALYRLGDVRTLRPALSRDRD